MQQFSKYLIFSIILVYFSFINISVISQVNPTSEQLKAEFKQAVDDASSGVDKESDDIINEFNKCKEMYKKDVVLMELFNWDS